MLPARQELIEGIKLRAVAHVLVHVQDLCQDAADTKAQCYHGESSSAGKSGEMGNNNDPLKKKNMATS